MAGSKACRPRCPSRSTSSNSSRSWTSSSTPCISAAADDENLRPSLIIFDVSDVMLGRRSDRWPTRSRRLSHAFATALHGIPDIQARQMFGYPAAFANTKMFAGLFQDTLIVRLSEPDRDVLRSQ